MAKCDLCGADCKASELVQLLDSYQVPGVVDICPSCRQWADKLKSDMLLEIAPRLRAAIAERQGQPPSAPRVGWLKRLVHRCCHWEGW